MAASESPSNRDAPVFELGSASPPLVSASSSTEADDGPCSNFFLCRILKGGFCDPWKRRSQQQRQQQGHVSPFETPPRVVRFKGSGTPGTWADSTFQWTPPMTPRGLFPVQEQEHDEDEEEGEETATTRINTSAVSSAPPTPRGGHHLGYGLLLLVIDVLLVLFVANCILVRARTTSVHIDPSSPIVAMDSRVPVVPVKSMVPGRKLRMLLANKREKIPGIKKDATDL